MGNGQVGLYLGVGMLAVGAVTGSAEGDFVTGHYANVTGEWDLDDTEWDFNDSDWNESDGVINGSNTTTD
ncbi:MAG: hypothetical protein ACOCY6_03400 [Halodesulfurarchaeum sp.]